MIKAYVEEVNGTVMLILPMDIVDRLHLSTGSEVEIEIQEDKLMLSPATRRGRYDLEELLANSDPAAFERTEEDWEFLNSPPVGRELI